MVHDMVALVTKPLSFIACYDGFYSAWITTLRNHQNPGKDARQSHFALHQSVLPNGCGVYHGEAVEMGSPLATKAIMVGGGLAVFPM